MVLYVVVYVCLSVLLAGYVSALVFAALFCFSTRKERPPGVSPIRCPYCGKGYQSRARYDQHVFNELREDLTH